MTKCPYVPPHPWNVDFPHLMLRAKAYKYKKHETRFRDKLLSSTDALGKLNTIPVVVQTVNAVTRLPAARAAIETTLGIDKKAWLPSYTTRKFRSNLDESPVVPVKNGERTPGKVAIFATCYINYNEPGIGHDLAKILAHNGIPFVIAEKEVCCGMPKLELGDLDSVAKLKEVNIPQLLKLAQSGYAILTPIPSCTLMFKQELPLMFPDDKAVQTVKNAMFDPFEYLVLRNRDGLLRSDFKFPLGNVSYHVPCHSRVQNVGQKTREVLQMVPETQVNTVERCSGHSGTWGVKKEFHKTAMKIGKPVFRSMAQGLLNTEVAQIPDYISSDCQLAGHHIAQGIEQLSAASGDAVDTKKTELAHPLTLIRMAYGLE